MQSVPSIFKHFSFNASQTRIQLSPSSPYWSLIFFVIRIKASLSSAYLRVESSHGKHSTCYSSFYSTFLNSILLQTTRSPVLFRNSLLPSVGTFLFHSGDRDRGFGFPFCSRQKLIEEDSWYIFLPRLKLILRFLGAYNHLNWYKCEYTFYPLSLFVVTNFYYESSFFFRV